MFRSYGKGADALTAREAAALAVVLPSPLRYNPLGGGRYVESRTEAIYRIMIRRGIVIPAYEQMLNENSGNETPPEPPAGDPADSGEAGAPDIDLHYIKTKDGKEVDFSLSQKGKATHLIEVKVSDDSPSASLNLLAKKLPEAKAVQLVQNLRREQQKENIAIVNAGKWLAQLAA